MATRPFFFPRRNLLISYYQQQPGRIPEKHNTDLVNERIHFPQVMLIGPNGEQLGIMSSREANQRAQDYELDLLCVAPNARPPVCKILNYGKYRFEAQKKAKENKRNQAMHTVELKEIQLTPQIGEHDLLTKVNRATEFLKKGDKVKVVVRYRGRQMAHIEVGREVMDKFIAQVSEVSTIEHQPNMEGRFMIAILASKFKK
ncbi:MAG: translation initiation factor IF-3 [Bacilli bacterium]|nr:translation initiation factor IF-3 [Bacilli bacterium]